MVSEIVKKDQYEEEMTKHYFWRTHSQLEIDLIRENQGVFQAYEFKWNPVKKSAPPVSFMNEYKAVSYTTIHPKNYQELLS